MAIKALLISYNFPPLMRAGSLRTAAWFKHFSDEIDLTVVTRKWADNKTYQWNNYYDEDAGENETEIVHANKKIVRVANKHNWFYKFKNSRFARTTKLNKLCAVIEVFLKWTRLHSFENERGLYFAAKELMLKDKYDLVLVSGEPFVSFKYAYQLHRKFGTSYILDYRDPWIYNVFRRSGNKFGQIHLEKRRERLFVKNAQFVTTISPKNVGLIQKNLTREVHDKFVIIPNGLDDALLEMTANRKQFQTGKEQFVMTFIGTLYPQHNVHWLLKSIDEIIENQEFTIHPVVRFVGSMNSCPPQQHSAIEDFAKKHPEHIQILPQMPQSEAWAQMFQSDLLIKFNAFAQEENHFGKKLYEYAASGKLVLSINHNAEIPKKSPFFEHREFQIFCGSEADVKSELKLLLAYKNANGQPKMNDIDFSDLGLLTNSEITKQLELLIQKTAESKHV
jgi:glycosyltransferase involved in cell wall biosynthesis